MSRSAIDWESIHRLTFVDEAACWTSGCQSYCCTHRSDDLAFSILTGGAGMIFFEEEYDFLRNAGRLQSGFEEKSKRMKFPVGPGLDLKFVISKCALNGICTIRESRPLCCKLYPYLPRIHPSTFEVAGYVSGTVFDLFWDVFGKEHPCTLIRTKPDEIQRKQLPALTQLLRYPYLLFYFRAVELFLDSVADGLRAIRRTYPSLSMRDLSKKWELSYLSGTSIDVDKFRAGVLDSYQAISRKHPGLRI